MAHTNSKKARLTAAARRLIHAAGYTQTTLGDIARAADVPVGNVYYYFKTKDALAEAVIEEQTQEFAQLIRELDRLNDPRARIDGFLSMLVLASDTIAAHGCPVGGLCTELNKNESPLAAQANALLRRQLDWLRDQFQQMGKHDEASDLALQLLTQLQGATVLAHAFSDPSLFTRQIADAKSRLSDLS